MVVRLTGGEWDAITLALLTRSGGLCEARTPDCLAAPDGRVAHRGDDRVIPVSRHHRQPRGMGGTSADDVHALSRLLLACGDGVTGCHGFIEARRFWARARGLLVPQGVDPATVPVELAGGRLVLLDDLGGFYIDVGYRVHDDDGGGCRWPCRSC